MHIKNLADSLNVTPVPNVVCNGDLIEVHRGIGWLKNTIGTTDFQETLHRFHPGHRMGGNHYHKNKIEVITVLENPLEIHLVDPKTKTYWNQEIQPNHQFTLVPEIAHALFYRGNNLAIVLEHASLVFNPADPRKDVIPFQILDKETYNQIY
jgi:hypothetical protein